jgi:protein involved in polysaccharide export with SLBB domain/capsular polysaccharide biosynthesis protein
MINDTNGQQPLPSPLGAWAVLDIWSRHWRWIAASTLVVAAAGALVARVVWSRSFESTAQLIRYEASSVDDSYHPRALAAPSLVVMLQAPGLLEDVGAHLKTPVSARVLAEHLEVALDRNNDVVTVTATGRSPEEAIDTVNRYCAAAIAYTKAIQRQEAVEVGDNLNHQLEEVESSIASTRKAISPAAEPAVASAVAGADTAAEETDGLTQRIQAARERLDDLVSRYTDAHPLVREQRARLAALVEEQSKTIPPAAARAAARPRVAPSEALSPLFYGRVTPEEVAMTERVRTLETNRALLIERQRAIQPFRENPPGYFRVLLSAASSPTRLQRYRLEIALFACMGAILGLFGSAGLFLLRELLDNRIRTRTDVRRVTGLPLLATLGDLGRMSPAAQEEWAFRAWTALQRRLCASPSQGVVCGITSANAGDGRSTWIGLLSRAARTCGFRVLTIDARPSQELSAEPARIEGRPPPAALVTDDLSAPEQVVDRLTRSECPPVVSIPLPGWVWNIERRKQWRLALAAWKAVHHVVILVDLPPALVAESVLLAETIPNLAWLCVGDRSDAAETLVDLGTLRDASCNLVGAFFNRERAAPLSGRFGRWLGGAAVVLLAGVSPAGTEARGAGQSPEPAQAAFSAASAPQRAPWQERLTLGPGDVLSLHLYGSPELTRENVSVGPDGMISYLEAQDIDAAGLTVDELRGRINAELGRFRRAPEAYVTPVAYRSKKYYMMGTVVQKGAFTLDHPTSVIEAVARARGFETGVDDGDTVDAADFSRSFLARGSHRVPVDFERLFVHGDLSQNVALEPNDYLYFPAANSGLIYVLGAVDLPGPVAYDPSVSALSAIASRGGFTERAWRTHVLVLRGSLDHPVAFKVDVAGALTGDTPNLALRPGDLVYVSDRPWIRAEELLDHAASAFVESAVVTWTGLNVGPSIISRPSR